MRPHPLPTDAARANPTRRGRATEVAAALAIMAGAALVGAAHAGAQDVQLPSGPATSEPASSETDGFEGGIDFGDAVVIDENGVRWNVDAETDPAEEPAPAAPVNDVSESGDQGTAGTGDPTIRIPSTGTITDPNAAPVPDEPVPTDQTGPGGVAPDTGSGSSIFVTIGAIAGVIALALGALAVLRRRRTGTEDLVRIEEPIAPSGEVEMDLSSFDGGYDGASDAGAYHEGGAAYAQYAAAATGEVPDLAPQSSTRERLSTMRAAVVDRADKGLNDSGKAKLIASRLEAAGSNTRPGEWLVLTIAIAVGAFCFVAFFAGIFIGVLAAVAGAYASWFRLGQLEGKRRKAFSDDLPETLQLLAGSLRGGLSMMQAIQTVSDEADEPTASEFQRIMTEARLGRDLAVSFRDLAERMDSKDFDWVVTAIEIHREVGGDLASILDRVGDTIRSRNRVLGQVKALSAEGRMSGLILFMLPPGMLAAISALNPEYLQEMSGETAGQILLLIAAVLLAAGGLWLKKLAKFVY